MNSANSSIPVGVFFLIVLLGVLVLMVTILADIAKGTWRRKFGEHLRDAILKDSLKPADIDHLAERWSQNRGAVLRTLRILHCDAISGSDSELSERGDTLRNLLSEHQEGEPFAELPENISIQLSRLSTASEQCKQGIANLAASLSELYTSNRLQLKKQRILTVVGFFFAVLGLPLTIQGLYLLLR
jgi:hypothetical protein